MKKKPVKIKHSRTINHICDKIFLDSQNNVEFYTLAKKRKDKSLFGVAFKKTFYKLLLRSLIWFNVMCANFFIAVKIAEISSIISKAIIITYAVLTFIAFVCYFVSFKGNVLQNIVISPTSIIEGISNASKKIEVTYGDAKTSTESYKKLDAISQIIDSDIIRVKKIYIMNTLKEEYDVNWDFETDSILTYKAESNQLTNYLKRVEKVDDNALGFVSRCYLGSMR